jgi:uncharacterized protein DUF2252
MGQRVVAGQRLMQASSDIFLGWQRAVAGLDGKRRDFYVRQLRDRKYSIVIEAWYRAACAPAGNCAGGHWPGPTPAPRPGRHHCLPRRLERLRRGHHPIRGVRRPE